MSENKKNDYFSISKEYRTEVNKILNQKSNKSKFICEAIIEKYNQEQEPLKNKTNKANLKEEVKNILIDILINNSNINLGSMLKEKSNNVKKSKFKKIGGNSLSLDRNTEKQVASALNDLFD